MPAGWNASFLHRMTMALLVAAGSPAHASTPASHDCTVPAAIESRLQPGKLLLVGEVHGTVEAPAALGRMACKALEHGRAVSVGLELFPGQVEPLATYMASDGGAPAVARLLHTPFWTRTFQDGRSSVAMLDLIERLRVMKQRYPDLNVFVLEDDAALPLPAHLSRDQKMAARVRTEHEQRPQALVLTLSGNIHNRLTPLDASPGMPEVPPPMGTLLTDLAPRSVLLTQTGGTAWMCTPECGVHARSGAGKAQGSIQTTYRELAGAAAYTEEWLIGPSTAAAPAVQAVR